MGTGIDMKRIKYYHLWWNKHGIKIILSLIVISMIFAYYTTIPFGIAILMMLTVPCSMDSINDNKILFTLRQLYFLTLGFFSFFIFVIGKKGI